MITILVYHKDISLNLGESQSDIVVYEVSDITQAPNLQFDIVIMEDIHHLVRGKVNIRIAQARDKVLLYYMSSTDLHTTSYIDNTKNIISHVLELASRRVWVGLPITNRAAQ